MEEGNSVAASQAGVQTSTTTSQVGNKSVNNTQVSSEKTQNTQGEVNDTQNGQPESVKEQMVPKSRMDDYRVKAETFEKELSVLREKASVLERLESAFNPKVQQDPIISEADNTLRQMGYVRGEDVQSMVQSILEQREMVRDFGQKITDLSSKYDGSKGEPKFVPEDVAKFMDDEGIKDPEKAYKLMNEEALADLKLKSKLQPTYTERAGTPVQAHNDTSKEEIQAASRGEISWADVIMKRLKK
jgi:hypothetical protein